MPAAKRNLIVFIAICLVLLAKPASAYRPFFTEDAGVAGHGITQTELSWIPTNGRTAMLTRSFCLLPRSMVRPRT